MIFAEPFKIVKQVVVVFEELNISYFVGGSLASSLYGIPRTTQDVDIIADIKRSSVPVFVTKLKDKFYVDDLMILDAINRQASFNIIYLETMFKIDIFVLKSDQGSQNEMLRKQKFKVLEDDTVELIL